MYAIELMPKFNPIKMNRNMDGTYGVFRMTQNSGNLELWDLIKQRNH